MIQSSQELAQYFDHTNLKAFAEEKDFRKLCEESRTYGFKMVAINSYPVAMCKEFLKGTPVHVGAAISFPLGQTTIEMKAFETRQAIVEGADEIDYVVNIGKVKEQDFSYIKKEMETIVDICRRNKVCSKVIFENCYLTKEEIRKLAEIALEVLPDFIKTSTGFGTGGALLDDVQLMKSVVGNKVKVKASGGIKTLEQCLALIEAGAERIGSSSSIEIVEAYKEKYEK